MSTKRSRGDSVLHRQDIAARRRALNQKKMKHAGTGRRAIAGVFILAVSILLLLSVATFDAKDRMGPGFRNAIGPVGHALGELLRGVFGMTAFVVPMVGLYVAGILFVGDRERRRWPQGVSLGLLLIATAILFQLIFDEGGAWAHAPGGLIGRELGSLLTALFSTVGTVVLASAIAVVAFIVGTQFAFLRFCSWLWNHTLRLADEFKVRSTRFMAEQKRNFDARRLADRKAKEEEAAFLAELEAEEADLAELEAAAAEAEAISADNERLTREKERARLGDLAEKERLKAERERAAVEREAARLAKDALRTARSVQREQRKDAAASLAPSLLIDSQRSSMNQDPAWVTSLSLTAPPQATDRSPSFPPRKVPQIIEPPEPHATQTRPANTNNSAPSIPANPNALAIVPASTANAGRVPIIVEPKAPPKPSKRAQEQFEFVGDRTSFAVPPIDLLEVQKHERTAIDKDAYLATAERLSAKLRDFGIDGEVVEIRPGPVVTMYEFKPAPGVKISRIASLADDLAMAMEAMRVRIVAPIPGKGVVGIEVPNREREIVFLKEIAEQDAFQKSQSRLTMCLGKDIEGMPYIFDLSKAPHLLIAGTTGSGKSVAVNAMIMSILLKSTPEEVRFIMVDPKMLELSVYEGIPHLLLPVVTDPRKAAIALQWAVEEMTRRYKLLAEAGVRNILGYNQIVAEEQAKKKQAQSQVIEVKSKSNKTTEFEPSVDPRAAGETPTESEDASKKKRRVIIVDVTENQNDATAMDASAHTSTASPRPSFDMGVPSPMSEQEDPREGVSAAVAAEVDAAARAEEIRINEAMAQRESELEAAALAEAVAESSNTEPAKEERTKLPYIVVIIDELADLMMVASKEVETSIARLAQMARAAGIHLMVATQRPSIDVVTGVIKANFPTRISFMLRSKPDSMTILGTIGAEALLGMGDMLIMPPTSAHLQRVHGCYVSETEIARVVEQLKAQGKPVFDENILKPREDEGSGQGGVEDDLSDELYDQALAIVCEMKAVSISMLQRKMRIGYNRSARMIERMEREGVVGPADGARPREVLVRSLGQMPGADMM